MASGFKAARYVGATADGPVTIVGFAGTDFSLSALGDTASDIVADVGFAGAIVGTIASAAGGIGTGMLVDAGARQLREQITGALEFTRQAQAFAGAGSGELYVVGHSLGGGLAQIICAQLGLKGVAFNAPAVSQMGYSIANPRQFFCVNQARDPVSGGTSFIGNHLGTVVDVDSGAMLSSHLIAPMIAWFEGGPGAGRGAERPF